MSQRDIPRFRDIVINRNAVVEIEGAHIGARIIRVVWRGGVTGINTWRILGQVEITR